MNHGTAEIEQWDRYWACGNIHSFSQVSGGNYQGAIAELWRSRFGSLEPGARIVDIATGNGALALLALDTADELDAEFDVHGVDLAAIDPCRQVADQALAARLGRIDFHGRTAAEDLPFDSAGVDMVCSQYGLEYSDLSRSIPEVARVLKPAGRLAAVLHHRDSALLDATRQELAQLDFVLNDVKLYLRARNVLRAINEARRSGKTGAGGANPKLQKKRRALNDAMERIRKRAEGSANANMLLGPARYVHEIFGALDRTPPAELLAWLDEAWQRVAANQHRLLDMTGAAMAENDTRDIGQALREHGFGGVEIAPFHETDGVLLGWRLEASKA